MKRSNYEARHRSDIKSCDLNFMRQAFMALDNFCADEMSILEQSKRCLSFSGSFFSISIVLTFLGEHFFSNECFLFETAQENRKEIKSKSNRGQLTKAKL